MYLDRLYTQTTYTDAAKAHAALAVSAVSGSARLDDAGEITQLIRAAADGNRDASDELFETVYRELRTIAKAHRGRWHGNDTLNTTALVNEAYVRMASHTIANFNDRVHFFATASRAMRQILINYAERLAAEKRGANPVRVTLSAIALKDESTYEELLHINELLEKLEANNARHCRLFECRVFGGMTIEETAEALQVSPATVKRDWTVLSAWLYREMTDNTGLDSGKDAK